MSLNTSSDSVETDGNERRTIRAGTQFRIPGATLTFIKDFDVTFAPEGENNIRASIDNFAGLLAGNGASKSEALAHVIESLSAQYICLTSQAVQSVRRETATAGLLKELFLMEEDEVEKA